MLKMMLKKKSGADCRCVGVKGGFSEFRWVYVDDQVPRTEGVEVDEDRLARREDHQRSEVVRAADSDSADPVDLVGLHRGKLRLFVRARSRGGEWLKTYRSSFWLTATLFGLAGEGG